MEYLIISLGAVLFIIGIIFLIKGKKYLNLCIKEIEDAHRDSIKADLIGAKKELEEFKQLAQEEEAQIIKQKEMWQSRAADAQRATQQILRTEDQRLAAEISKRKELGEIRLQQDFDNKQSQLDLLYQKKSSDLDREFLLKKNKIDNELEEIQEQLNQFQAMRQSVNEAILRQKQLEEKEEFYSIDVSENDQEDIKILQSMDLKLHNRDVIPKLIWDLFIRRSCQEMCKRITNGNKISGIYKITNKKTGEAYIGKTTDITTRWQNHCKTAIGLEGCARATLHSRLAQDGLWNYTWEILEQVDKDNLSSREAFYIDLYGTKQQLNMKEGSKNGIQ